MTDQKQQNRKRGYYPLSCHLNVNMMLSNITFYDFCCFWSVTVSIMDNYYFYIYIFCFITNFGIFSFRKENGDFLSKWRLSTILIFQVRIFLVRRVKKTNLHRYSKFHRNHSNGFWDTVIILIFNTAAICHLHNLKSWNFDGWWGPYSFKISQSIPEILRFFQVLKV